MTRIVAALMLSALATATSVAQDPRPIELRKAEQVIAYYQGLSPRADFAFKWKGEANSRSVGLLNWSVPGDRVSTGNMGRDFRTFCAQTLIGVTAGETYKFEINLPEMTAGYGLKDDEDGKKEALYRTAYIRELFGRYYVDAINPNKPDEGRAFQIALWEIINEGELPANKDFPAKTSPFDLYKGTFQANYPPPTEIPVYVARAQAMLVPLTGDENQYYANPDLAGYRLVRMNGLGTIANPNEVVQAQFALQKVEGGIGGGGAAVAGGGIAGSPFAGVPLAGGGGAAGGGVGGGSGGGGGLIAGTGSGNNGSTSTTTTTTTGSPPTNNTVIPPVGQPPETPQNPPPTITQFSENNPVPGPPGILLGFVGLAALGGYRVLRRATKTEAV
jgi:hypothetical protein